CGKLGLALPSLTVRVCATQGDRCCNSTWQSPGRKSNSSSRSYERRRRRHTRNSSSSSSSMLVSIALECGCGGSRKQTRGLEIWNSITKVKAVHTINTKMLPAEQKDIH
ncbi:hypothetical protein XELAEV_18039653mg, partial [Xenopus laevis]